jgi:hypothetical protein
MAEHPHWSRRRLSIALCEALNWRTASGQLKDMSARLLLNKLASGTEPLYVDTQALRAWLLSACPSGTKAIQCPNFAPFHPGLRDLGDVALARWSQ